MKRFVMPEWWYSPDDEPDDPELCAHCQGEDAAGKCECPMCSCGEVVTNGEDHRKCHLIDEY